MLTLTTKTGTTKTGRGPAAFESFDRAILESTAQGCFVVDRDHVILYANPAFGALLGHRDGALLGDHLFSHIAEECRPVLARQVAIRDFVRHRTYDVTLVRSDGELLRTTFTASRMDGPDGQPIGSCVFVTDITRRHEADQQNESQREQLADTVSRLNRFLGQICQELKDPLSAILAATEMMSADDRGGGADAAGGGAGGAGFGGMGGYAALCSDAGRQILRTIENLSLWSRLQLNQVPMDLRPYEVGGLLQDVLEELTPRALARDILIVNRIFDTPVLADLGGLTTVLKHLIDNAVRFSPSGSIVMLTAGAEDGRATIRVQDNGFGIPEDVLPHLFRIDHHHAGLGADGEPGSGLGLLICKALVERMGGTIHLDSQPGGGTAVSLTLAEASPAGPA